MGKSDATKEEMLEVLAKVRLEELVNQSALGLEETLQEGGANLSGGQRQRFALARALLYDADVYIFDEATSNIDDESEEIIQELIHDLSRNKVVIVISHRLVHVQTAESIYVMDQGQVVESGTHIMDSSHRCSQFIWTAGCTKQLSKIFYSIHWLAANVYFSCSRRNQLLRRS